MVGLVGVKYYWAIKGTPLTAPFWSMVQVNFASRYYALFFPAGGVQEAVRWYKVTKGGRGRGLFLAATAFERLTFMMVLLIAGLVPLTLASPDTAVGGLANRLIPLIAAALIICFLALICFFVPQLAGALRSMLLKFLPSRGVLAKVRDAVSAISLASASRGNLIGVLGLSFVWLVVFVLRMFILVRGFHIPLGITDIMWISSLVLILQTLPVTVAGIGLREGAYAYLFTLFGLLPSTGVLIGLFFFMQMILIACVGGIFEWTGRGTVRHG